MKAYVGLHIRNIGYNYKLGPLSNGKQLCTLIYICQLTDQGSFMKFKLFQVNKMPINMISTSQIY
jgi:hypothetical protein